MKRQERLARQEQNGELMKQLVGTTGIERRRIIEVLHSRTPSRQPFNQNLRYK